MELNNTTRALIYLMRCALQDIKPEPIQDLDYEVLYKLSCNHSVVAMVAMALESGDLLTEQYTTPEIIKKWKDAKVKAIRKNILLDTEREEILSYLEAQGIWYLPLKGSILKDMYPKMGMRQMADNDILFDISGQYLVKDYMVSRGYQVVDFDRDHHDVYEKPPVYNFEFHTSLFSKVTDAEWDAYYENITERLIKDDNKNFSYQFTDEDFYIYVLLHGYKHFSEGGTGIRFLADIFVFMQKKGRQLDEAYLTRELGILKIDAFEKQTRELAFKLFREDACSLMEEEQKILDYLMGAGTYGTVENRVSNKLEKMQGTEGPVSGWTKVKYALGRAIPSVEYMKLYSPFCRKHPWSIPFFWVYRWIRAATVRRKNVMAEFKAVKK